MQDIIDRAIAEQKSDIEGMAGAEESRDLDLQEKGYNVFMLSSIQSKLVTVAHDLLINDISREEAAKELFEAMQWVDYKLSPLISNQQKEV